MSYQFKQPPPPPPVEWSAPCPQCGRGAQWISKQFSLVSVRCEPCDREEGKSRG